MFSVVRSDEFDVSDGDFLPGGDLLLLERRFNMASGVAMRIRRIKGANIVKGATVDGEIVLEADMGYQIDNMECLDVWTRPDGAVMMSVVSDDNHSILQTEPVSGVPVRRVSASNSGLRRRGLSMRNCRLAVIPGSRSGTRNPEVRMVGIGRNRLLQLAFVDENHLPVCGLRARLRRPGMTALAQFYPRIFCPIHNPPTRSFGKAGLDRPDRYRRGRLRRIRINGPVLRPD